MLQVTKFKKYNSWNSKSLALCSNWFELLSDWLLSYRDNQWEGNPGFVLLRLFHLYYDQWCVRIYLISPQSATTPSRLILKKNWRKKIAKKSQSVLCVLWSRLLLQIQEGRKMWDWFNWSHGYYIYHYLQNCLLTPHSASNTL